MSRASVVIRSCVAATVGFVIQLCIVLAIGFGGRWRDFFEHVATSVLGLFLAATILGFISYSYFTKSSNNLFRSVLIGATAGWLALWVQVLFGSSVEFFRNSHASYAFEAFIFRPVFWVIFLGTIPSLIIGGLFGLTCWWDLQSDIGDRTVA